MTASPIDPQPGQHLEGAILPERSRGLARGVVPDEELTTAQAAELLHLSESFLVRHLLGREIPFEAVGRRGRRVRLCHVLTYRERRARERRGLLDDMTAAAQDVVGGYR